MYFPDSKVKDKVRIYDRSSPGHEPHAIGRKSKQELYDLHTSSITSGHKSGSMLWLEKHASPSMA